MSLMVQNSILKQAEDEIEKRVSPVQRQNYMKILTSGMKVALNKGKDGIMGHLKESKDPIVDVVNGAIGVVGILRQQSQGTMPLEAMVPAAMALVIHGLDILDKSGIMKIGKPELDRATQLFAATVMKRLGLTEQKVQALVDSAHGAMQNPEHVAQMKQQMGATDEPA